MRTKIIRGLLLCLCVAVLAALVCSPVSPIAGSIAPLRTQVNRLAASATPIPTREYVVQPGDTPLGVALMYGTMVETLIALNADIHPEMGQTPMKFNAGWRIRVPAQSTVAIPSGGSSSDSVQSSTIVPVHTSVPSSGAALDADDGYFDYDGALEIIRLTNEERAKAGLAPLVIDEQLMEIARKRAVEIVNNWGHQGLDDDCPDCGENLVKGGSVTGQFQWWISSEGHRGGILWPDYAVTGVARYILNGKAYAVQLFR